MRSSKFICTVGPTNCSVDRLQRMFYQGMSIARLNLSHGTLEEHSQYIKNISEASKGLFSDSGHQFSIATAVDLCGSEIRTGTIESCMLRRGDLLELKDDQRFAENTPPGLIFIDCSLVKDVKRGSKIYINDGAIKLDIEQVFGKTIVACVIKGGELASKQTVYIPDLEKSTSPPYISDRDRSHLEFAVSHDVDFILAAHVECSELIDEIKEFLGEKAEKIQVYAKIQNLIELNTIKKILEKSDGIVFAPTIAIDPKSIPTFERAVLKECKIAGKPCLRTIDNELKPADIYQALKWALDGGDNSILTNATSQGKWNPIDSMKTLKRIDSLVQNLTENDEALKINDELGVFAVASVTCSKLIKASAIIIVAKSQEIVLLVQSLRPRCPIFIVYSKENFKLVHFANLLSSVNALVFEKKTLRNIHFGDKVDFAVEYAIRCGACKPGDSIVVQKESFKSVEVHYIPYQYV